MEGVMLPAIKSKKSKIAFSKSRLRYLSGLATVLI